jgi:hypothetical protein
MTELAPLLIYKYRKTMTYGLPMGKVPDRVLKLRPSGELPHVTDTFTSIHQARHVLDGLAHQVIKLMRSQDLNTCDGTLVPSLKTLLAQYEKSLATFERSLPVWKQTRLSIWLALLKAHQRVFTMVVEVFPFNNAAPEYYRAFSSDFRFIQEQYDQVILPELLAKAGLHQNPSHDSDVLRWHAGVIPPLAFVASKCPEPTLRNHALNSLRLLRVREKGWDSCIAAKLIGDVRYTGSAASIWSSAVSNPGANWCCFNSVAVGEHIDYLCQVSGYQGALQSEPISCTCAST